MSAGATAPAKPVDTVKRDLVGGPWKGRTINVPEKLETVQCGFLGWYQLDEDGTLGYRSRINAGYGDCPK